MMAASAIYTGWSSWNKSLASAHAAQTAETRAAKVQTNLDKALTALANLDVRAVNVASQVGRVDSAVTSISAQVEKKLGQALGIRPENQSPEKISQGLKAAQATASIATPAVKQGNAGITIQYFPKDLDRDLIQSVLLNNLQNAGLRSSRVMATRRLNTRPPIASGMARKYPRKRCGWWRCRCCNQACRCNRLRRSATRAIRPRPG